MFKSQVGFVHFNFTQKWFLFSGWMKVKSHRVWFLVWTLILRSQHCICVCLFDVFHFKLFLWQNSSVWELSDPIRKAVQAAVRRDAAPWGVQKWLFTTKYLCWSSQHLWRCFGALCRSYEQNLNDTSWAQTRCWDRGHTSVSAEKDQVRGNSGRDCYTRSYLFTDYSGGENCRYECYHGCLCWLGSSLTL